VLDLPRNPNLGTKFDNRALANVLSKHGDLANVWNIDKVLVANTSEANVDDFTRADNNVIARELRVRGVEGRFFRANTDGDSASVLFGTLLVDGDLVATNLDRN